jgi:hypothetical protein|tara:strand:+ start:309 stop:587 length:279 start_codon:yes stop_codon:yes gene_type:complete
MAIGDFVTGISTTPGTPGLTIQPAGTNVLCMTSYGDWSGNSLMSNGVIVAYVKDHLSGATEELLMKLFIDNTNYLIMYTSGNGSHYSGVQVK